MEGILGALPALADIIAKGGVVGLMLVVCGVLAWEVMRLRKQSVQVFAERDAYRLAYAVYKQACDAAGLKVDLAALQNLPIALPNNL